MKTSIIFTSYSGTTRGVAEQVRNACGGELIEVRSQEYSTRISAYTIGCFRAIKEQKDRIEPAVIDVSGSDPVVIGTPVWGGKPNPAINGAIAALQGCSGKRAILFATCGGNAGETFAVLERALAEKGMIVAGKFAFTKADLRNSGAADALIAQVLQEGKGA